MFHIGFPSGVHINLKIIKALKQCSLSCFDYSKNTAAGKGKTREKYVKFFERMIKGFAYCLSKTLFILYTVGDSRDCGRHKWEKENSA